MSQWFYNQNGEREGPVEEDDLRAMLESGTISVKALVWTKGQGQWVRARDVDALMPEGGLPPPVPPSLKGPSQSRTSSVQGSSHTQKPAYPKWPWISFASSVGLWLLCSLWVAQIDEEAYLLGTERERMQSAAYGLNVAADAFFQASLGGDWEGHLDNELGKADYIVEKQNLLEDEFATASGGQLIFFILALVTAGLWIWQHNQYKKLYG